MNPCGSCQIFRNARELLSPWSTVQKTMTCRNLAHQFHILHWDGRRFNSTKREEPRSYADTAQILTKILERSPEAVRGLLTRGRCLLTGNEETMAKAWKVLQKYGFGLGALNEYPKLLLETPATIENSILIMNESGFCSVRPTMIMKYKYMSEKSISALKATGFIPEKLDVLEQYFEILNVPNELREIIRKRVGKNEENLPLNEVRMFLLANFLAHRLEGSADEMTEALVRYPRNKHRSFRWISGSIQILMDDLKFPRTKIKKHAYLLQLDPARLTEIITTLPTLGGRPLIDMVHHRPKILMSPAVTLSEIDDLFVKFGISHAAIAKYPEIYTFSSKTIRSRLEELDRIPQFTTFKSHPRIARVIYYQNKMKKRIEYLESMDVHGVSLHILSTDTQRFEKFVQLGQMTNKGADIIHFVSNYLGNGDKVQVRQNLLVHPNWLVIPVVSVKAALHFLKVTKGFQAKQIMSGLPVVLYPVEKIINAMKQVKESGEAEETDPFYLQMVLYFLEKPGHFTGDGVWTKSRSPEENGNTFESESEGIPGQQIVGSKRSRRQSIRDLLAVNQLSLNADSTHLDDDGFNISEPEEEFTDESVLAHIESMQSMPLGRI